MYVLRIERLKDGYGPYAMMENESRDTDRRPIMRMDRFGKKTIIKEVRYGCARWSALRRWWHGEDLHRLHELGYVIATYAVSGDIVREREQVAFDARHAVRVSYQDVRSLAA